MRQKFTLLTVIFSCIGGAVVPNSEPCDLYLFFRRRMMERDGEGSGQEVRGGDWWASL
jgi:hypothetical protein